MYDPKEYKNEIWTKVQHVSIDAPEQVEVKVEAFATNCRTTPGCLAHLGDRTTAPSNRPNRPTTKVRVPADALRVVDVKAAPAATACDVCGWLTRIDGRPICLGGRHLPRTIVGAE